MSDKKTDIGGELDVRLLTLDELMSELRNYRSNHVSIMRPDETTRYDMVRRLFLERLRSLESECIRRKRIKILRRQSVSKPSCSTYFETNGFIAKSEILSTLWDVNPDEARRLLRLRVSSAMDRLLLDHSPLIRRPVGGDAWIHIFDDVDSAILWARDMQMEIKKDSVTATVSLDWGEPLLIESGALDRASITAIKIAEKYGDKENQILLTEEAKLHMVDPYLIGLCKSIEPFVSRTLGKVCLHRIKDEKHSSARYSFNFDLVDSQRQKPPDSRHQLSTNFQMSMKVDLGSLPTLF